MTRPSLDIIGVIKRCSATQEELMAHIRAFDRKPEPIAVLAAQAVVDTLCKSGQMVRKRGRYKTRDMRPEA